MPEILSTTVRCRYLALMKILAKIRYEHIFDDEFIKEEVASLGSSKYRLNISELRDFL